MHTTLLLVEVHWIVRTIYRFKIGEAHTLVVLGAPPNILRALSDFSVKPLVSFVFLEDPPQFVLLVSTYVINY